MHISCGRGEDLERRRGHGALGRQRTAGCPCKHDGTADGDNDSSTCRRSPARPRGRRAERRARRRAGRRAGGADGARFLAALFSQLTCHRFASPSLALTRIRTLATIEAVGAEEGTKLSYLRQATSDNLTIVPPSDCCVTEHRQIRNKCGFGGQRPARSQAGASLEQGRGQIEAIQTSWEGGK